MGKIIRWGCLGLLGIVLLLVAIGLLAGGRGSETRVTGQAATQAPAKPQEAKPQESKPQEAKPQEAAGKPSGAISAKVGQRIESAGIALTVNGARRAAEAGPIAKAKPGRTYMIADVSLENANRERAPYNPLYFKVRDADGFEYTSNLMAGGDQSLKSGELATGERVRGTVAFDVPEGARGLVMTYQPQVLFGGYQTLRVELE